MNDYFALVWEFFIFIDNSLLLTFNGLSNPVMDAVMPVVSMRTVWIPLYLLLFCLAWRRYGWKGAVLCLLTVLLAVAAADQLCGSFLRGLIGLSFVPCRQHSSRGNVAKPMAETAWHDSLSVQLGRIGIAVAHLPRRTLSRRCAVRFQHRCRHSVCVVAPHALRPQPCPTHLVAPRAAHSSSAPELRTLRCLR